MRQADDGFSILINRGVCHANSAFAVGILNKGLSVPDNEDVIAFAAFKTYRLVIVKTVCPDSFAVYFDFDRVSRAKKTGNKNCRNKSKGEETYYRFGKS